MQQTSWNICPVDTPFASGCYYNKDNQFAQLAGASSAVINDMPDGNWTIQMKRDIFSKTKGAVSVHGWPVHACVLGTPTCTYVPLPMCVCPSWSPCCMHAYVCVCV